LLYELFGTANLEFDNKLTEWVMLGKNNFNFAISTSNYLLSKHEQE